MLPKAHLTLHSRMSGSRWVTIPSWLFGSLRPFLHSYSVYSSHIFLISSASLATAKSLQSCLTLCDWLHRWQPTRLRCPWDSPGNNTRVGCHFLLQCMKVKSESKVTQSCPTLSDPMDCSLPGSSAHGIFQARAPQNKVSHCFPIYLTWSDGTRCHDLSFLFFFFLVFSPILFYF